MYTAIAYWLFPVEILYFFKLREEQGLNTTPPNDHILWQEYTKIQEKQKDTTQDTALKRAFDKAALQGFLSQSDWDFFNAKAT